MRRPGHKESDGLRILHREFQQGRGRGRLPDGDDEGRAVRLRRRQPRPPAQAVPQDPGGQGDAERRTGQGRRLRPREDILLHGTLPEHGHSLWRTPGHNQRRQGDSPGGGRREDVRRRYRRALHIQIRLDERSSRSGSGASHLRGGPHIELPPLADGLFGALFHGCVLARVQIHRPPEGHQGIPGPP